MPRKTNLVYYATAAILAGVLFALFHIFPLSGDDWFREDLGASLHSVGDLVQAVIQKWSTTNGRILGNALAYTAGSRPIVRDVMRTGFLLLIIILLTRMTQLKSAPGLLLCTALVLFLPRVMFRDIYPWAAGYFNYVPPVAFSLLAMYLIPQFWEGKPIGNSKIRSAALFLTAFAAQLFVENITLYMVASAAFLNVWQYVRYRKISAELLCELIGAIGGAVLLFASPSYQAIFLRGEAYQFSGTSGLQSILVSAQENCGTVFHSLLADCPVLYLSITMLLGISLFHAPKAVTADRVAFALLILCSAAFIIGDWSDYVTAGICLLWFLLTDVSIFRLKKDSCKKALYFLPASLCAAFPLLFVSPIGPRCLYISYVFLLVAALDLLSGLNLKLKCMNLVCSALCAAVIIFDWCIYYPLHQADLSRRRMIEDAMAQGMQSVTVPTYQNGQWLRDPDSPKMQYAYYYETPNDFTITFVPQETSK